jgi:predicted metal-dependent peptidase
MSDGGIGNGLSYFAIIKISGDLDKDKLKAKIAEIEDILKQKDVNGKIVSEARVSTASAVNAKFSTV